MANLLVDGARDEERTGAAPSSRRVAVLVPTTGGTAIVCGLEAKPRLPRSKVTRVGDFRAFPIEQDYHRLVEGAHATLGDTPGNWHLTLSDRVETGRSWELPVLLAHRAVRHGAALTGTVEEADLVILATGAVDAALDPAGEVRFVAEKLEHAAPILARLKPGAEAIIVLGAGGAPADVAAAEAAAARLPNARAVAIDRFDGLESLVVGALGGETGASGRGEAARRAIPVRPLAIGLAGALAAVLIVFGLSILQGSTPSGRDAPLAMLALEQLHAESRAACIEAYWNGSALPARHFAASGEGLAIAADPVTCALRFRNVGAAPMEVALDQGLAGLVIPGVSPIGRRLAIVNGTHYDLVFHTPPAGRESRLTVHAGDAAAAMTIRFEAQ